jgi:hypothetical protein
MKLYRNVGYFLSCDFVNSTITNKKCTMGALHKNEYGITKVINTHVATYNAIHLRGNYQKK